MKLKYLLPFATVASVATIMTPLVASCSVTASWDYSWKRNEVFEPIKPKSEQHYADINALTSAYRNDIASNKKIFSNDKLYFLYKNRDSEEIVKIDSIKVTTSKIGPLESITGASEHLDFFRISFSLLIEATYTISSASKLYFNNRLIEYKNIPVSTTWDETEAVEAAYLGCLPFFIMSADDSWSVNAPKLLLNDGKLSIDESNFLYNSKNIESEISATFNQIYLEAFLTTYPNYYINARKANN